MPKLPSYRVIVGNIGTVYTGSKHLDARIAYEAYVTMSKQGLGKPAGEPVTLLKHGEPIREYPGTLEQEE